MNNAGVDASGKHVADLPTDVWDRAIRANVYGPFFCCRAFIRLRTAAGGGRSIPHAVYTDPSVAGVGMMEPAAQEKGIRTLSAASDLSTLARASVEDLEFGRLVLVADRERGVLCGASAIGPQAETLIAMAQLAIHAETPLVTFEQLVHPFPSWTEAYTAAIRDLASGSHQDRAGAK